MLDVFIGDSYEEIENNKENLADEKPIVHHGVYCNGKDEQTVLIFGDKLFQSNKQKREKRHNVKKMVKEKVIYAIAGKGIEKAAHNGKALIFYKAGNVKICGYGGGAEFKHKKRSHKIGHGRGAERQRYKKERAEKQIEGI